MSHFPPIARVGPLYVPGETGCFACQEIAYRRDYPLFDVAVEQRRAKPSPAATLGPACGLIGGQIGMEVMHLLTGLAKPSTQGVAHIYDLRTMEVEREAVVPEPELPGLRRDGAPAPKVRRSRMEADGRVGCRRMRLSTTLVFLASPQRCCSGCGGSVDSTDQPAQRRCHGEELRLEVRVAWIASPACRHPQGASRWGCSVGSYRCQAVVTDRG